MANRKPDKRDIQKAVAGRLFGPGGVLAAWGPGGGGLVTGEYYRVYWVADGGDIEERVEFDLGQAMAWAGGQDRPVWIDKVWELDGGLGEVGVSVYATD